MGFGGFLGDPPSPGWDTSNCSGGLQWTISLARCKPWFQQRPSNGEDLSALSPLYAVSSCQLLAALAQKPEQKELPIIPTQPGILSRGIVGTKTFP